eukprot:8954524-Pyramimonas_sp.AAC.1
MFAARVSSNASAARAAVEEGAASQDLPQAATPAAARPAAAPLYRSPNCSHPQLPRAPPRQGWRQRLPRPLATTLPSAT